MLARGYPVFARGARGARFTDADGNEFVDYLMGFGPIVLGHGDEEVADAVARQAREGVIFSTAHEKELEISERILKYFPWAGMIGFAIGGSAVTSAAVRLARAYTGRDVVLRCGYHGWHDWTSHEPIGVPQAVRDVSLTFPYGDLNALGALLDQHKGKVAGVIIETFQGAGPATGYLQGVVDLAHQHGALCMFDEVKTGCRLAFGGAGALLGVDPDVATFGKAWCNGFPGGFYVGRREILSDARCQKAWLAATFHCELASFAAMEVVLNRLEREDGIGCQRRLGERFMAGINAACERGRIAYRLVGHPAMPQPKVDPAQKERVGRVLLGALARGHYIHPGHCMFFSLAHTAGDIDGAVAAVEEAIAE
jgi:glutamate-1-semialdehyde 2,1-aminomutase